MNVNMPSVRIGPPQELVIERERAVIFLRSRKVDIGLPGKGNSNSRGARPVYSFR